MTQVSDKSHSKCLNCVFLGLCICHLPSSPPPPALGKAPALGGCT